MPGPQKRHLYERLNELYPDNIDFCIKTVCELKLMNDLQAARNLLKKSLTYLSDPATWRHLITIEWRLSGGEPEKVSRDALAAHPFNKDLWQLHIDVLKKNKKSWKEFADQAEKLGVIL